jgi:ribosomal protein S18 acetylase RimI-like enzyme
MNMSFEIATPQDVSALSHFVNQAYRGDSARQGWTHEADLLDGTRVTEDLLNDELNRGVILVKAIQDQQLVGCYHFEFKDPTTAYVGMITVDPTLQARGIGKLILEDAIERARRGQAAHLQLTVMSEREELIAYYERRGFRLTGKSIAFEGDDKRYGLPRHSLTLLEMERVL